MPRDHGKRHMFELDGLRGLAALSVVLSHLPNRTRDLAQFNFGDCGVLIFFALSGFLMGHLYLERQMTPDSARKFVVSRVARIVPLYYAVVILAFLASPWLGEAFTYQMDWMQFARLLSFNGSVSVFWSVGPEFQFYFFFLTVWLVASMAAGKRAMAMLALVGFIGLCYATSPYTPGVLFVSKLHIFMAGVGLALLRAALVRHRLMTDGRILLLQALSIIALVVLLLPLPQMLLDVFPWSAVAEESTWYYSDLPRTALASLIILAFSFGSTPAKALLANGPVREIGQSSFAIYLLHVPLIDLFEHFHVFTLISPWVSGLLCTAAVVAVSMLVNRGFEAPVRRWITGRFAQPARAPGYAHARGRR